MWSSETQKNELLTQKNRLKGGFSMKGGPSDRIRTCGILLPKQARYQLRYTRLFSFFIRLGVFSQTNCDTLRSLFVIREIISQKSHARWYRYSQQECRRETALILSDFRPACKRENYSRHCAVSPAGSIRKNSAIAKRSAQPPGLSFRTIRA